ncbi:uncharacterized protein LOC109843019 [Asparagus officinalis]|uniref:uncharacterized protein LOC109843019 n=1 Tax=Asparagus officinalis TaxID=4686 RepID=UPI00098E0BBE|nr:uncharacterized protein LOC109843019 [Asparagus officinalis]
MGSNENCEHNGEIQKTVSFNKHRTAPTETRIEFQGIELNGSNTDRNLNDSIPVYIPSIENGLMPNNNHRKKRFFDFLRARPTTNHSEQRRFHVPFIRKISWSSLLKYFKKWIKDPANVALFIWVVLCAIGIVWVGLFMIGALNGVMPNKDQRDKWEEVINQVVNALFNIMCIYQHPLIFHHLVLVLRWRPNDQVAARKAYSKNGLRRPNERAHILIVVLLLHLTCIAQYVYCALFWGWSRFNRPEWPQYVCIVIGALAPILAAWYTYYGPLAKEITETRTDEESQTQVQEVGKEVEMSDKKIMITTPKWIGGLFDCWDDITGAFLSCFCTCCVFGWNMERLGFGNMYVHIISFVLLCMSPFWIFAISANNVDDDTVRLIIAIVGAVCSFLGLLYGGYWRAEMRKKFNLPGNPFCCGYPFITDSANWLFCWSCSLAQEVRTANFYDIESDGFYRKITDEEGKFVLVPLPREGNLTTVDSYEGRPRELSVVAHALSKVPAMSPPSPLVMQTEDDDDELAADARP